MTLSDQEIAGAASAAGFSGRSLVIAVAVALAESGGNPSAKNPNGGAAGLWQIYPPAHADLLAKYKWDDPKQNAEMAWIISSHGTNWRPWTTYTSGAYRTYLPRAERAAKSPASVSGSASLGASGAQSSYVAGDLSGWLRVGLFLLGGLLILIAFLRLTNVDNVALKVATKGLVK